MPDKKTLITIIVLLVITIPLSLLGTINHFQNKNNEANDNPNKEFIYNNKVYFYKDNNLISYYECQTKCERAVGIIDDTDYHTNYFKNGTNELPSELNDTWGMFKDNNLINLYNITGKSIVVSYDAVKNYGVEHLNNILIVKKDEKWGVPDLNSTGKGIKIEYDYIALPAHIINGKLDTTNFIVKKENEWNIMNMNGEVKITPAINNEIVDFNDKYYVTYDDKYHIYDYNNNEYLQNFTKDIVYATSKYIIIELSNSLYVFNDCNGTWVDKIELTNNGDKYFNETDKGIEIIIDNEVYQSIALS